jgi:hypothetical protein
MNGNDYLARLNEARTRDPIMSKNKPNRPATPTGRADVNTIHITTNNAHIIANAPLPCAYNGYSHASAGLERRDAAMIYLTQKQNPNTNWQCNG